MLPNSKRIVNRIDDISEKFFAYFPPFGGKNAGADGKNEQKVFKQ